jgi:hypothetical protein
MVILKASVAINYRLKICVVELLPDLLNDCVSTDDFKNCDVVQLPNIPGNPSVFVEAWLGKVEH